MEQVVSQSGAIGNRGSVAHPVRYVSHALVEVRRYRFVPVFVKSAVLLDMSLKGFKFEFTSEVKIKPADRMWLSIPLAPLGISAPPRFQAQIECKWFSPERFRVGGVFVNLKELDEKMISQIVERLQFSRFDRNQS